MSCSPAIGAGARALEGVRAVIVNNFPGPGMGGGEVLTLAVVRALAAAGADVRVIVVPGSVFGARAREAGASVIEIPMSLGGLSGALRTVRHVSSPGSVVMGTGYFTNIMVRLASGFVSPKRGARVVNLVAVTPGAWRVDGGSPVVWAARDIADRVTRSRVGRFVAVSHSVARTLERSGVRARKIVVIPNAVDTEALERLADSPLPDGLPDGSPLIVCAARLEPVKGVEYLIRAAASIPGGSIVVVGDGSERPGLESLATELGVSARVTFLNSVPHLAPLLRRADVVVLPSLSEGLPLVVLEAMALARPVVATAVGGVPDLIVDRENGMLVPPADAGALGGAIATLLCDPMLARRVASGGHETVHASYTIATLSDAYVRLFAELAGSLEHGHA